MPSAGRPFSPFLPDLLALLLLLLGLLLVLHHLLELVVGLQVLGLQLRRLNRCKRDDILPVCR